MELNKEETNNMLSIFKASFQPKKYKLKDNALEIYVEYYSVKEVHKMTKDFFDKYKDKVVTFIIDYPTSYYFILEDNNYCLPSLCIDFN